MMAGQGAFTPEELAVTANATFGWWHHSLENDIDKIAWDYMDAHLRTYASYLWELCTALVLPLEFVSVARQLRERLQALVEFDCDIGIAQLVAKADALKEAAQRLDDKAISLRAAYESGVITAPEPADSINSCLKRLSRLLIPVASTVVGSYGHDPYALTPQGTVIPSLFDLPRLSKLPQGSEAYAMLEPEVLRARNRVGDVLDDGVELIQRTIREIPSLSPSTFIREH
jgi:hypothetical protein